VRRFHKKLVNIIEIPEKINAFPPLLKMLQSSD